MMSTSLITLRSHIDWTCKVADTKGYNFLFWREREREREYQTHIIMKQMAEKRTSVTSKDGMKIVFRFRVLYSEGKTETDKA